jgi:hypothetical protein
MTKKENKKQMLIEQIEMNSNAIANSFKSTRKNSLPNIDLTPASKNIRTSFNKIPDFKV